jgi:excisionase family DNA binding protein
MLPSMTTTPRYLLIDEAAEIARTSPNTIRYWIATGRLPSRRPGRRRLIAERDLIALIEGTAIDVQTRRGRVSAA